ncbi:MAG: hypothetical protein ACTHKJ_03630, partial [Candidatus Nitrosocosmicus sp.]
VSVRSTIHSLEILIGEVESSRSISNNTLTIPRFSDIYCISQSSKFELDEIEDTTENKAIFLNSIINETIKEVSKEFFSNLINAEELISIKNEFKGKTFTVLQNQYQKQIQKNKGTHDDIRSSSSSSSSGGGSGGRDSNNKNYNNSFLYTEQLKKFPITKKILKKAIEKIKEEQREIIKKAQVKNIDSNLQYLDYNNNNKVMEEFDKHEEIIAAVTELLLEYLRFSLPPILDKKEENKSQYTGV